MYLFIAFCSLCFAYVIYGTYIKQYRILPEKLKESLLYLDGDARRIDLPGKCVIGTNPGVIKKDQGYLLVFRAESTSFFDYVIRHVTFQRNKELGLVHLSKDLEVVTSPVYLKNSAPGVKLKKQSPNDPRLIEFQGKVYAFYNDRATCEEEKGFVRQLYMCEVFDDGFGEAKKLHFPETDRFTNVGLKFKNVEKNWSPFVFNDQLYLVYLIEPHVVIHLDIESGECQLVSVNEYSKIWDFGIARGGTPAIELDDYFLTFFHSPYKGKVLGHSHPNIYIMGAYAFSKKPPFEILKKTEFPLADQTFFKGIRKFVFPTALVDEGKSLRIFYGRDDKELWSWEISKDELKSHLN